MRLNALVRRTRLLAEALMVIGRQPLAYALLRENSRNTWRNLSSRARTVLPDDSGFVTFQKKVVFEIGPAVAADLMARVSESLATSQDTTLDHAGR